MTCGFVGGKGICKSVKRREIGESALRPAALAQDGSTALTTGPRRIVSLQDAEGAGLTGLAGSPSGSGQVKPKVHNQL